MSNQNAHVLAIDIGSSAIRAAIYDSHADLSEGSSVTIPHSQVVRSDGTSIEDAIELANLVDSAIDRLIATHDHQSQPIVGVGVASMASTILGVDANGEPVTPVYTYADSRPSEDVVRLRQNINVAATYQRTGVMQHWSYVPARILWMRRTSLSVFNRVHKWLDFPTFLYGRWFGFDRLRTSHSLAAWSGMLNRSTLDWDPDLLSTVRLEPEHLPDVSSHTEMQSELREPYANRWKPLQKAGFALAVGDGAAVNIGTGCVAPNRIAITVGTTAAMRLFAQHQTDDLPKIPRGLWGYPLTDTSTLIGGAFTEGGNVVKWCSDVLKMPALTELDHELNSRDPASHRLTVLPFLSGERATGWATDARATISGLTTATDSIDIVRAMMEAVACRFSLVAELLVPYATQDAVYVAGGNAMTSSEWWVQTIADVLGSEVHTTTDAEATTRGAAILALHANGAWKTLADVKPNLEKRFLPRPEFRAQHLDGIRRQRELYDTLIHS